MIVSSFLMQATMTTLGALPVLFSRVAKALMVSLQRIAVIVAMYRTLRTSAPMVDGLVFAVSSRGMQGRLQDNHPCSVAPGKRPRLTPSQALALKDGGLYMAWGTPGGDVQTQSMLQVFLNVTTFGLQMQQAIEAPRVGSFNFPNSFSPHGYLPGRLCVENRFPQATVEALEAMGYDIEMWQEKSWSMGAVCAIKRDAETGMLHAGADPRQETYAMAW